MCVLGGCVGGWGDVIGGHHKIYAAFTVEQVVKCNYKGESTHRRAAAQQADWQEGKETSDQGLFICTVSPFVSSPFILCLSLSSSTPINQLQQVQKPLSKQLSLLT